MVALELPTSNHFLVEIGVLQLDVLDKAALRSVAALASLSRALEGLFDLISSPAVSFLLFWCFLTHLVLKLFLCFFLSREQTYLIVEEFLPEFLLALDQLLELLGEAVSGCEDLLVLLVKLPVVVWMRKKGYHCGW